MNSLYLESSATYFFNLENINLLRIIQKNGITPSINDYIKLSNKNMDIYPFFADNTSIAKEYSFSNAVSTMIFILKKIAILIGKGLKIGYNWFKRTFTKIDILAEKIKKLRISIKAYPYVDEEVLNLSKNLKIIPLFTINELVNMISIFNNGLTLFSELDIIGNTNDFISSDSINFEKIPSFYTTSFKSDFLKLKNDFIGTTLVDTGNIYIPSFKITTTKHIDSDLIELGYLNPNLLSSLVNIEMIYKEISTVVKNATNHYKNISKIKDRLEKFRVNKVDNFINAEDLAKFNDWFINLNNLLLCLNSVTVETNNFLTDINMVLDYYTACLNEGV